VEVLRQAVRQPAVKKVCLPRGRSKACIKTCFVDKTSCNHIDKSFINSPGVK
jgi:hypothetical protein